MKHPELVHGLELLPCAIRDGMLYIPHADGNWVSAAKLQPFSLKIIEYWRAEQVEASRSRAASEPGEVARLAEEVELPDVEDLSHQIAQDCLSFGLSADTVARYLRSYEKKVRMALAASTADAAEPIDMVLHCPACGLQHIDGVETDVVQALSGLDTLTEVDRVVWSNPPHRSHLCHDCGHVWRPADVPTNGVAEVKTCGKADSATPGPRGENVGGEQ